MARCQHTAKPHSSGTNLTDILTYRYDRQLVYVPVAPSYNEALSHARDAFPQLKDLHDASLSLSLLAPTSGHAPNCIGISAPAWPKLVAHMSRYQIVDVHPIPDITITYADAEDAHAHAIDSDPAPPYQRSDDHDVEDEKAACGARPRSPSTSTLHRKRSWFFQRLTGQ
ncbi:hypothetical protein EV363DRAFT_1443253 [Boletus edulis]|nr:hypothetical protein EV363DRAFT_1443253 [Boletus edulis]